MGRSGRFHCHDLPVGGLRRYMVCRRRSSASAKATAVNDQPVLVPGMQREQVRCPGMFETAS